MVILKKEMQKKLFNL